MNTEITPTIENLLHKVHALGQEIADLSNKPEFTYSEQSKLSRAFDHLDQVSNFIMQVYQPQLEANH